MSVRVEWSATELRHLADALDHLGDLRANQGVEPGSTWERNRISFSDCTLELDWDDHLAVYVVKEVS